MLGAGHLPELIIILIVVVMVFGAKRLPDVGAGLGKGISEFRRSTRDPADEPPVPAILPTDRQAPPASRPEGERTSA